MLSNLVRLDISIKMTNLAENNISERGLAVLCKELNLKELEAGTYLLSSGGNRIGDYGALMVSRHLPDI